MVNHVCKWFGDNPQEQVGFLAGLGVSLDLDDFTAIAQSHADNAIRQGEHEAQNDRIDNVESIVDQWQGLSEFLMELCDNVTMKLSAYTVEKAESVD